MEKYFTTGINMLQAKEHTSITHILLQQIHHQNYHITRRIYSIAHYSRSCLALQGGEFKLYILYSIRGKT